MQKKRELPIEKVELHPRNKHRKRYNLKELCACYPELAAFVKLNEFGDESLDFFNAKAVKALNTALLIYFYGVQYWDIPQSYLCPPIPGRADYIHNVADLLAESYGGNIPNGKNIRCLDIGVGANCVYPIIGNSEYGWSFVGSDIDSVALKSASQIVEANSSLKGNIDLRLQRNSRNIFSGIIKKDDLFDVTICNPPFHRSAKEAQKGTRRKLSNLKQKRVKNISLNFGGQSNELWCDGGEERFVSNMIYQSKQFEKSCLWFTTLISKKSNLSKVYEALKKVGVVNVKTIPMGQGNKISRIVAWSFISAHVGFRK